MYLSFDGMFILTWMDTYDCNKNIATQTCLRFQNHKLAYRKFSEILTTQGIWATIIILQNNYWVI